MGKKTRGKENEDSFLADPEVEEKKRLRSLAFSQGILGRAPANPSAPLEPSKSVVKLDGKDIVKRGHRKSRYLFSFPGILAPLSGGRVGELADLGTRNPILYLEFPQGRMKLFGTHVYPKNKYLSLQLTKSSKGVVCEDSFDSMIVFSDVWWVGLKEENPEELQLEFPKDFTEGKHAECDFKGGAGATSEEASGFKKPREEYLEPVSPEIQLGEQMSEESIPASKQDTKNIMETTSVRQSARTVGKILNYVESSGGDSSASDADVLELVDERVDVRSNNTKRGSINGSSENSSPTTSGIVTSKCEIVETENLSTGALKKRSSLSSKHSNEKVEKPSNKGALVQTNLSTLFEKAVKKQSKRTANDPPSPKGSGAKRQRLSSKQMTDRVKVNGTNKKAVQSNRKDGTRAKSHLKQSQIKKNMPGPEEISSESQDYSDDDEDWAV